MKKTIIALLMALTMVVGLNGCASSKAAFDSTAEYAVAETAAVNGYSGGAMVEEAVEEMAYDIEAPAAYADKGMGTDGDEVNVASGRKLIKTVYLNLETKNLEEVYSSINAKVESLGGYIENSNINNPGESGGYHGAYLTVRIPTEKLDDFITSVEGSGNVTNKNENVNDVTLQYTDTESRIKSLKAEEDRLIELLNKAEDVESLVTIEDKLADVRYRLDSFESQKRVLDNQIEYTSVSIDITEVKSYTPPVKKSVWERIKVGFVDTLYKTGEFFEDLFVGIIVFSPAIIGIGLLVVAIVFIVKAIKKKKASKAENKKNNDETITDADKLQK